MTPEEYVRLASERLSADGAELLEADLPSGTVLAGHHTEFRPRWATKVHLFTVLAPVPEASVPALTILAAEAVDFAERTEGRRRALRRGMVVVPALVASAVLTEAKAAVEARPDSGYAALVLPAVVDLFNGRTYSYAGSLGLGTAYAPWVRARLAAVLPPPPPAQDGIV